MKLGRNIREMDTEQIEQLIIAGWTKGDITSEYECRQAKYQAIRSNIDPVYLRGENLNNEQKQAEKKRKREEKTAAKLAPKSQKR